MFSGITPDTIAKQMHRDWLKEHQLPIGACEIIEKCPLYTSRFISNNVKEFACESAKGNLYSTKINEVVAVLKCPYLSLVKVKK